MKSRKVNLSLSFFISFLFIINLILSCGTAYSGWVIQNSGTQADLFDVCFINASTGIAAGGKVGPEYGLILRTTNGGLVWDSVYGGEHLLRGISFTSAATGYAVGNTGTILKSTNGGINWFSLNSGTTEHLRSVSFPPSGTGFTGFICGFSGKILKTVNAGVNWESLTSPVTTTFFSVNFYDPFTGSIAGGNNSQGNDPIIIRTTNGGVNWTVQSVPINSLLRGISFINQNTGIAAGNDSALFRTTNGGVNWTVIPYMNTGFFRDVFFVNDTAGYICAKNGYILNSSNAGLSWDTLKTSTNEFLEGIYFYDLNNGAAVGHSGVILKYNVITGMNTSVNSAELSNDYELLQNYPNPFNPETEISYNLKKAGIASVKIFDSNGKEIQSLVNEFQSEGMHKVNFGLNKLSGITPASGIYFYSLFINSKLISSRKMVMIK